MRGWPGRRVAKRLAFWLSRGYSPAMSTYSVADAKNNLSELIDRALQGEGVIITRHGAPVVELRPMRPAPGPLAEADLAWLDARRVTPLKPLREDAGALISGMRDEDAH